MEVAVYYYTRSGNTKKVADVIASELSLQAKSIAESLDKKVDILFLGSSPYAFDVDENIKEFIKKNKDKIGIIYNFSTAAAITSTYKYIAKVTQEYGVKLAKEEYYCRGSFGIMHKNHPNEEDLFKAKKFAKQIIEKGEE